MASAMRMTRLSLKGILKISTSRALYISRNTTRSYLLCSSSFFKLNQAKSAEKNDGFLKHEGSVLLQVKSFSTDIKLNEEDVTQKVLNVCRAFDKIPAEKLTLDSHFMSDLGLDSLDHVELIMSIEEEFNFEVPDADAEKLLRPKDIINYIVRKEQSSTS